MINHTIFHASDLHLGAAGGIERGLAAEKSWAEFEKAVTETGPDLIILSGDLVVDDPDDEADHRSAHKLIAALPSPVIVVPGNHDVGDHRLRAGLPGDWHGKLVSDARVAAWEQIWGRSYGLNHIDGWDILALNSQLLGSGLARESEQWHWIEHTALPAIATKPFLLVAHESLDSRPEMSETDNWMSIPSDASARLTALLKGRRLVGALSGHTHRFVDWTADGIRNITAPSLAGPIPVRSDMSQAVGDPSPGWLTYTLRSTGDFTVDLNALTIPIV